MSLWPLQVFDPKAGFSVLERKLPHWSQAGTICFITWRTLDSIPKSVLNRWHADRDRWLRRHGINPKAADWKDKLHELDRQLQGEFVRSFSERWHRSLDACHGACVLKRPELSQIVIDSLLKFDGERYEVTDFVVMPNHVHMLAAFVSEDGMLDQCEGWKHYQAVQLNREIKSSGRIRPLLAARRLRSSGPLGRTVRSAASLYRRQPRKGSIEEGRVSAFLEGSVSIAAKVAFTAPREGSRARS